MSTNKQTCLTLLCFICTAACAADWPTYQHDNRRTGVASEELRPPLSLQWIFKSPFPPAKGWAPPVNGYGAYKNKSNVSYDDAFRVVSTGGIAYFCSSSENKVYALDAQTGAIKWEFFTDASPRLTPTIWKGRLYFGADDGMVYCLDAYNGDVVWRINCAPTDEKMLGTGRFSSLWPVRAGVMVDKGVAYFTAGLFPSEGVYLYAVNAEDGRIVWRRCLDEGGFGGPSPQGYVLDFKDSIFVTSRVTPSRWSKKDGSSIRFETPLPKHWYRFYDGGTYAQIWRDYIVYGKACLLINDPERVRIDRWKKKRKGDLIQSWFNARQFIFKDGVAYLATDYHLIAVDEKLMSDLSEAEWREFEDLYNRLDVANQRSLLERYQELVGRYGEDHPMCRRMKNGPLKWGRANREKWKEASAEVFRKIAKKCRWMTPIAANESMIMAGSVIYAGGEDVVAAIDSRNGELLWREKTGSRVRGLAAADGRLFVSAIDGKIRCYAAGAQVNPPRKVLGPKTENPYKKDELTDFYAAIARQIVNDSGVDRGYCLILGGCDGRLAFEIAKRTSLRIQLLERDLAKVAQARRRLSEARLYGGRICVERADLASLPYPPYIFNLVIDQSAFFGGESHTPLREVFRVTKPHGGVAYVGQPTGGERFGKQLQTEKLAAEFKSLEKLNAEITIQGAWTKIRRGGIPGAKNWTHNYASAANTYCSDDPLVKGPFGILWYGGPGPRKRIERHASPPIPLVVNGVMFTLGYDLVMAYDIYNGIQYWERLIPGATRAGLPLNASNLVADERSLFVVVDNKECLRLDAKTGETINKYPAPTKEGAKYNFWGWVAKEGDLLFGSRPELDARRRRASERNSEAVFAINANTGEVQWTYHGRGIEHGGIAVGDGKVFLVDRNLTAAERLEALKNTIRDNSVEDRKPVDKHGNPIEPDLRKIVALDAKTGAKVWERPFNATDITLDDTVVSGGRVGVACMYKDKVLVVHGAGSLGHPWREFLAGEFARRAIYAYSSDTGGFLWGGRRNYRKRPIIVGDYVYAEPYAWRLKTGEPKMVVNPLSGKEQKLDIHRGYIGCGHLLASAAALFGARGGIAYYNVDERAGFVPFANVDLGCGLGMAPANGVLVVPEGRSGCTCPTPIFTSVVLYPRKKARAWGGGVTGGMFPVTSTPVKRASINLGAPGYREDEQKNLWIPYSGTPSRAGTGLIGKWLPSYQHDPTMFFAETEDLLKISGADKPWVFTSSYQHTKPLVFRMIDKGQAPATYTARLYFAEHKDIKAGERVFSVFLQDKPALTDFDIVKAAGGSRRAIIMEIKGVEVADNLKISMKPSDDSKERKPLLCGFQVFRE